jgi:CMP-N,N'-diacetyllegionaminic acid synthase
MRVESLDIEQINCVALIPARSGSERVPHKNVRPLGGHPLLAYSVKAALSAGVFQRAYVVTDSDEYAKVAKHYGARVLMRPRSTATSTSPDIIWVRWSIGKIEREGFAVDLFAIVRPTSPFRTGEDLACATRVLIANGHADSIRGVKKVSEHPLKCWSVGTQLMTPLLSLRIDGTPAHSSQAASLPPVHIQDGSIDVSWARVVRDDGQISGERILPWLSSDVSSIDVNTERDWLLAELMLERGLAQLPPIEDKPYVMRPRRATSI